MTMDGPRNAVNSLDSRPSREEAEQAITTLLRYIGEDPLREGLRETPKRVVKSWTELFSGYAGDPTEVLERKFADVGGYDDMVLVRDLPFHSHCEHHIVPIIGRAHIAYFPDGPVLGLSKFARVLDIFSRRLQTQEAMTAQVAQSLMANLKPRGVAVMVEAEHLCMAMRGVRSQGSKTITTRFAGCFENNAAKQTRFLQMVRS